MGNVRELVKEGQATANGVIKKATQSVYESSFNKFAEFCLANGYPDPHTERHHELPAVLVAYLQSISASSTVSLQTAEKARSAVASYYSSHKNSDGTDVNKWTTVEDESGSKRGYGNPARDPFVRQFMRGLKKKKATEYVAARAVPVSLQMVGVLHTFLDSPGIVEGFTQECRFWFKAVSSFAFYGMCRINEVLTLKWRDISLHQFRSSVIVPDEMIEFGTYALFNRKTEVAEGRSYNLHNLTEEESPINAYKYLCNWLDFATKHKVHKWSGDDYVFSALTGLSKKAIKGNGDSTGCEKVAIGWGKKMGEQSFITLLNCIVNSLNRKGQKTHGFVAKDWYNCWFTFHTFRRGGAQYRFMYANPARRWSLRMIKWWAGWSVSESTETLVRYLLDLTVQTEDSELADCLAPDKRYLHRCPSAPYEANKNIEEGPVLKRLRQLETLMLETKSQITELKGLVTGGILETAGNSTREPQRPTSGDAPLDLIPTSEGAGPVIPAVRDSAHLCLMWWLPDDSVHLFKPLSEWKQGDRTSAGVTRSWFSVAKLLGEEVAMFATMMGESDNTRWEKAVFPVFRSYYATHYGVAGETGNENTFTISMLASFIRKDRKRRTNVACPAKELPEYSTYL